MDFKKYNVSTIQDLMNFFNNRFQYGFTHNGKVYIEDKNFWKFMDKYYTLKTGEKFIESGYGVCWDFCELERLFCQQNKIKHECYFISSFKNRKEGGPTHTFCIFEENQKWYWFEYSWFDFRGIRKYSSKNEAIIDIIEKFCKYYNVTLNQIEIYKTSKAKEGLNSFEFVEHCFNGEKVDVMV